MICINFEHLAKFRDAHFESGISTNEGITLKYVDYIILLKCYCFKSLIPKQLEPYRNLGTVTGC